LTQQSIAVNAPTSGAQFEHHLSLLSHKSDAQRRDSLAHLTTAIAAARSAGAPLPQPGSVLVPKVKHLICDASSGVRVQLLKLLQALPEDEVTGYEQEILLWIRAGMTHMAAEIRYSSLDVLSWLLSVAGTSVVSGPGAWFKTIKCFLTLLKWSVGPPGAAKPGQTTAKGWSTMKVSNPTGDTKAVAKTVQSLAEFLWTGLEPPDEDAIRDERRALAQAYFPLAHTWLHMIPSKPNAYAHLHLFGALPDEENAMLEGRDERQEVFAEHFMPAVERGLEWARREQGEVGRAAKALERTVRDGLKNYDGQ
jgi:pre-rRNA-processing protein IPI1